MKSKNTLLKSAIALTDIILLVLAHIITADTLQDHVDWVTLLAALTEGSLLDSLIEILQNNGK